MLSDKLRVCVFYHSSIGITDPVTGAKVTDVDYIVDDVAEVNAIIAQGVGWKAVKSITINRVDETDFITIEQAHAAMGLQ